MANPVKNSLLFIVGVVMLLGSNCPYKAAAQTHNEVFSKLSVEHGLSSVTVTSMLRDSKGYLWAGTEDGLNRYNGYSFKIYRNNPSDSASILGNRVISLHEDSRERLWISYGGGGAQYYDRNLDAFLRMPALDTCIIKSIKEDKHQRLWFAGNTLKSLDLKTNKWSDYTTVIPNKELLVSIDEINQNELWLTSEQALYRWNITTGNLLAYRHIPGDPNSLSCNSIYSSLQDEKGNLWIATRGGGLDKFDNATKSFLHFRQSEIKENGPLVNVIRSLCMDGDYLWLGTENGGLSKLDTRTNKFVHYTSDKNFPLGLNDNSIWSVYKDTSGSLWIGTFSFGICVIDPYQNKFSTLKVPLKNTIVNAIYEDSNDRLWIGTEGGVALVENGGVENFLGEPTRKSQNGIPVLKIYEDNSGEIWLGTWSDGIFKFNEQQRKFDHYATVGKNKGDLSNEHVYALHQGPSGELLIGTFLGLNVLPDAKAKELFWVIDSTETVIAPHNNLKTILEDKNSNLWIGTCNGLKIYNKHTRRLTSLFKNNPDKERNLEAIVFCLFEDSKGNVWAGTEAGLYHIQSTDKFVRYTVKNGLSNHSIMGILEDSRGNLWLSTSNGLTVFNPESRFCRNYYASDGLFINGFKPNAHFKGKDGTFYYGGSDGIITFDPAMIRDNPNTPRVGFEELRVFNQPVEINGADSILKQHISETSQITLAHDANMISIDFVALSFSGSNKNRYAYKLQGFDKEWNYVGHSRSATYTNLDPGDYIFEVKAANNDGIWNKETSTLGITILPPWWETPLAYVFYVLGITALFYLFRKVVLMKEQYVNEIKLERIRSENIERLNQAKLQFFTNVSHEFRTPLTLILGPVQTLLDSNGIDDYVRSKLLTAKLNVNRLHRLVNQLLDFRKAESGNMKIVAMEADLVSFLSEIKLSFDHLAEEMDIDFHFFHQQPEVIAWFDHDQMEKVISNLLSNAFKNTPTKGVISIHLEEKSDQIAIVVQDTGKGIKPEHLKNVFQPFFSYEKGRNSTGTGIGLALSKSLVELHHGKIEVQSIVGQSCKFTITLLPGNSHFKFTEIAPSLIENDDSPSISRIFVPNGKVYQKDETTHKKNDTFKILLVEDNSEVSDYLHSILCSEYDVSVAPNGQEGLKQATELIPDLIISDVMMPVMDGISLCKRLKENIATCHIPLIFLTARTSPVFKIEGLELGAFDYITKPFDSKILLLKIRNLLRTREHLSRMFSEKEFLQIEPKQVTLNTRDELFLQSALQSIEENMENAAYSVNDLCHDVGMSKATLFRKLKALTSQSANEFIRTIRLKRAAQLLSQDGFAVSEVAYKVGFNDPKYFRICFKKLFHVSPSEYAGREKAEI